MTTVSIPQADLRRSLSPDMFDDILTAAGLPVEVPGFGGSGQMQEVTFAADLEAATVTAVRDRLVTTGPAQESARAALRAAAAALPEGDPLRLTICYMLGDE